MTELVVIAVLMQGLLFMAFFSDDGGALLVMNPMTAKACVVNKFMFPSAIKHASTRYRAFCLLLFIL